MVIPNVLPHESIYTVQIGQETFKLSGASLSSDSPSYFTEFFSRKDEILLIDRSPRVFEKICLHLQGYSISVQDETEFVHIITDASYFGLSRLRRLLLTMDIFCRIGGRSFRIPRELITTNGNYPNFFMVTYDVHFGSPETPLNQKTFVRPPPLEPFTVSNRSPELFQDLLCLLQDNHVTIRDSAHRESLIRECKYYGFKALEQKVISSKVRLNPFSKDEEIVVQFDHIQKKGLLSLEDSICKYSRPFIDEGICRPLVIEFKNCSELSLLINKTVNFVCLKVTGQTGEKLSRLLSCISDDIIYESEPAPSLTVVVHLDDCYTLVNGTEMGEGWIDLLMAADDMQSQMDIIEIKVVNSQWRVPLHFRKASFSGVILEGFTDVINWHKHAGFL